MEASATVGCKECNGSGFVPLPRGMTIGFYNFMAPGCRRREDGAKLMLCSCNQPAKAENDCAPPEEVESGPVAGDLFGNHVHMCPECFDDIPCDDICTWEGDFTTNEGIPTLHPIVCDRCRHIVEQYQDQGSGI